LLNIFAERGLIPEMGLKIGMGPSGREINEFIALPEGLMIKN
jgi:hypothetical protein